jgi:hypothetical protein
MSPTDLPIVAPRTKPGPTVEARKSGKAEVAEERRQKIG